MDQTSKFEQMPADRLRSWLDVAERSALAVEEQLSRARGRRREKGGRIQSDAEVRLAARLSLKRRDLRAARLALASKEAE